MIEETEKTCQKCEEALGIVFSNRELLKQALTHRSFKISHKSLNLKDNENLEFLGDAVLNLCISLYLYKKYPDEREGDLSKKRAYLVSKETLVKVSRKLHLLDYVFLGKREKKFDLKSKENICGRAVEALIGAIFLEKGFDFTYEFVIKLFSPFLKGKREFKDSKTLLQEFVQKRYKLKPVYEVLDVSGPSHLPKFSVGVKIGDRLIARGVGHSKKEAENRAAQKALKYLKNLLNKEGLSFEKENIEKRM